MKSTISISLLFFIYLNITEAQSVLEIGCKEDSKISILGNRIGVNGFFAKDLDNNGTLEIVLTGNSAANIVLSESHFVNVLEITDSAPFYIMRYQTDYFTALKKLFVVDIDNDDKYEVILGHKNGLLQVLSYRDHALHVTHELDLRSEVIEMSRGDADNDGIEELAVGTKGGVFLIDELYNMKGKLDISLFNSLEIGNVDSDANLEIVTDAGIFEYRDNELFNQWPQPPFGFGKIFIHDLNQDGISEVVKISNTTVSIYDAGEQLLIKELKVNDSDVVGFFDLDNDGSEELFYDGIEAYDFSRDSVVFSVDNKVTHLVGYQFYDLDKDGKEELITAGGYGGTGPDLIYVYDLEASKELWKSDFINPEYLSPFAVYSVGNVDHDSIEEIVAFHHSATLIDSISNIEKRFNNIYIYDAISKQKEWMIRQSDTSIFGSLAHTRDILLYDLNEDGVDEILVAASYRNQPCVTVIDAQSREVVANYIYPGCGIARQLAVGDVDQDGEVEIVISTDANCSSGITKVLVVNSSTYRLEWESADYNGGGHSEFSKLFVADVDSDNDLEIVALNNRIYIFDVGETTFWISPDQGMRALTVANVDADRSLELIYDSGSNSSSFYLNVIDAETKEMENRYLVPATRQNIRGLMAKDLNANGIYEYYFSVDSKLLMFEDGRLLSTRSLGNQLNIYDNLISTDYGIKDNPQVILVGADHALYELGSSCYNCLSFSLTLEGTLPSCESSLSDGSIISSFEGGSLPISYQWENGSSDLVRDSLDSGFYKLLLEDAEGCKATDSLTLLRPTLVTNSIVLAGYCETRLGVAEVKIIEGQGPFEFLWSNGERTATADSLLEGQYTVITRDSNDCMVVDTVEVPTNNLGVRISTLYSACNDQNTGQAFAKASSGIEPYRYLWSNGDTTVNSKYLPAGSVWVKVTDNSGCVITDSAIIQKDSLIFESFTDVICVDNQVSGKVTYHLISGEPPAYVGSKKLTDSVEFENLFSGEYIVPISNYYCFLEDTLRLNYYDLWLSLIQHTINDSLFSVEIRPYGGKLPYQIYHNGTNISTRLLELPPGNHEFTVLDANGCTYTDSLTLGLATFASDFSELIHFSITPNPFESHVQISYSEIERIVVFNSYGQKTKEIKTTDDHESLIVELANEPPGVYYFYGVSKNRSVYQKAILQSNR